MIQRDWQLNIYDSGARFLLQHPRLTERVSAFTLPALDSWAAAQDHKTPLPTLVIRDEMSDERIKNEPTWNLEK